MTIAQIQGTVRFLMTTIGTLLAAHGASQLGTGISGAEPYVEACVGPLLALGSYVWNMFAHSPSGLGKSLSQTK